MENLLFSILALAIGPILVRGAERFRGATLFVDAFSLVAVGGLILVHILPESILSGGWTAIAAFVIGLLLPVLAEQVFHPGQRSVRRLALFLALAGMAVHATLDGIALSGETLAHAGHEHGILALAVILHRIPAGIGIWWIIPRTLGIGAAWAILAVTVLGTVVGFYIGEQALPEASRSLMVSFQALLGGSLLHVVIHSHIPPPERRGKPSWYPLSTLGALTAVVLLALTSHDHDEPAGPGSGELFLNLALESAPALLLAYLAVGLTRHLLPDGWIAAASRGNLLTQSLRGVAAGLPLPVCSCGVVPIYGDLVRRGASAATAVAFLVATPELEFAAILLSWQLMGPEITMARLLAAAAVALLAGMVLGRMRLPKPPDEEKPESCHEEEPERPGLWGALRFGMVQAVDQSAAWILVGLGVSALLMPHIDPEMLSSAPSLAQVPLAALLGLPIYVCASGSTPLAAVLIFQGLSPGAAIAFLLTGPATNMTTFGMLRGLHGVRAAWTFAVTMFFGTVGLGLLVDALLEIEPTEAAALGHQHDPSVLSMVCLGALAVLFTLSLARMGTRPFLEQLLRSPTEGARPDSHDHGKTGSCCD